MRNVALNNDQSLRIPSGMLRISGIIKNYPLFNKYSDYLFFSLIDKLPDWENRKGRIYLPIDLKVANL